MPDVTEHSNHHQVRHEPSSNAESCEANVTHQKVQLTSSTETITATPTATVHHSNKNPPAEQKSYLKKCCICTCLTIFIITSCAIITILIIQFLIAEEYSGDRESHDQRIKIVQRLLRDTPLIGTFENIKVASIN